MTFDRLLGYAVGLVGVLIAAAVLIAYTPASTPGPDTSAASFMLERVNDSRAEHGLAELQLADDLTEVAEAWSRQMAQDREMRHNPHYPEEICCWEVAAENVAWSEAHRFWRPGDRVRSITEELHQALLDSPEHRENLLDARLDEIGIGVHVDVDGSVWITQNFRRSIQDPAAR